jgi:hypothetical protein
VTDSSNPALASTATLNVTVNTEDRTLTDLEINGDTGTGTYSLTIDGSSYSANTLSLTAQGPDSSNDNFTYSISAGTFGAVSGSSWTFNPVAAGCPSGSATVPESFTLKAVSSHGQTITRNVTATVVNAQTGSGGGCPY